MFKAVSSSKATQVIINQIRSAILSGQVSPGEKLDSEKILMEEFGVSKSTLREALRALEYLGLVEMRKGASGGVYVTEVDMKITQESLANFLHFKNVSVHHLSEIRKLLEPHAAGVAAAVISPHDLEAIDKINAACQQALDQGREEAVRKDIIRFHRVIAQCTQNPILIFILAFIENLLEDTKEQLRPDKNFFQSVIASHTAIYQALLHHDAETARAEMLKDVSMVEENLLRIEHDFQLKQPVRAM